MEEIEKLRQSLKDLEDALAAAAKSEAGDRLAYLALAKAFEVVVEYYWKAFRHRAVKEGLDPMTPKAAVRDAAKMGLIDNPEAWLGYIDARNIGVHDYLGISEEDFRALAKKFHADVKKAFAQLNKP